MLTTLEKRNLVERNRAPRDGRRVLVSATADGVALIEELFPQFNGFEIDMAAGLSPAERKELSRLLRIVIINAAPQDPAAD